MIPFLDFIEDDDRIIKILCKIRAKLADNRHKQHLLNNMSPDILINIKSRHDLEKMLPPRKQWLSLLENNRYKKYKLSSSKEYKQKLTSYDTNIKRLEKTIKSALKNNSPEIWVNELRDFLVNVKQSVRNPSYHIHKPITYPVSKNKFDDKGHEECRPISIFQSLTDRIVISLVNQYLTILFDPLFYSESLAFRASRDYHHQQKYFTTHHDAIDRITEYRLSHENEDIFVAECDMQKFYDSVNHSIIKQEFKRLIAKIKKTNRDLDTSIIEHIFCDYLSCYNFPQNVFVLNDDKEYWKLHKNIKNGRFVWIEGELIKNKICKSQRSISRLHIGIPQGGALSGLISNIVLNAADNAVKKHQGDYLYLRYCDDMILMHTDQSSCDKILQTYVKSLSRLKLIPHEFNVNLQFRTRGFWKCKSKPVYKWDCKNGSDWIGFVGYEIKRTGEIRIRRQSLLKEKQKQKRVVREICQNLDGKRRISNKSIENSIRHKLICMSVGRVSLWNYAELRNELCWINGFKKLTKNNFASLQIRTLDKTRNNLLRKMHWKLKILKESSISPKIDRNNKSDEIIDYYGRPFSYFYHYIKNREN